MAPEVIDLISDSDDDISPTQKATSTLASFRPRKQKPTPRKGLPEQRQRTSHDGRVNGRAWPPAGHRSSSDVARPGLALSDQSSFVEQQNGSLADLLRREATASTSKPAGDGTTATPELQTRPTAAKRTGGSVAEERMRKSREFYMKEAQRKAERPAANGSAQWNGKPVEMPKEKSNYTKSPARGQLSRRVVNLDHGRDTSVVSTAGTNMSARFNVPVSTTAAPGITVQTASAPNAGTSSHTPGLPKIKSTRADPSDSSSSDDAPDVVPANLPKRKPSSISPNLQPPIKRVKEDGTPVEDAPRLNAGKSRIVTLKTTQLPLSNAVDGKGAINNSSIEVGGIRAQNLPPGVSGVRSPAHTRPFAAQLTEAVIVSSQAPSSTRHNTRYTEEEDARLFKLRDDGVTWENMPKYFDGRTTGSLQVRYSTQKQKRISKSTAVSKAARAPLIREQIGTGKAAIPLPPRRKGRKSARQDGFVSWSEIGSRAFGEGEEMIDAPLLTPMPDQAVQMPATGLAARDTAHSAPVSRILRARELGNSTGRGWSSSLRHVSDELQNHILDTLGPRKFFHGTSRDVDCVAWSANGNHFAAGSICISDERSMQYNRPYNLLLGNIEQNSLLELPEHHVLRPKVTDTNNVNALHAMQETQDPRLFKTVAAVTFSQDGKKLFSAGGDNMVRMYDVDTAACLSSYDQGSTVDLLSMHRHGYLATAAHRSDKRGIAILKCDTDTFSEQYHMGPSHSEAHASLPVFPSALRWGMAPQQSSYLLAGFSSDSEDEQNNFTGQVCLWDLDHDVRVPMSGTERNVFDIAWNPFPSSASSTFAVASAKSGRRVRSLIQCFAPSQGRAKKVLEWECPALDINDLIYCPHDDNLVAAGATDGKVYIWDKRYADRNQSPLHVFAHGATKNVLDHDRELEAADTGVRFLSWSATGNRLYSGSSDGTVKIWNPYKPTENALVKDVAHFNSAVMSGAFSPDYRNLLIGEDQGQLNLLSIDQEGRSVRAAKQFDLCPAPAPAPQAADGRAAALELVDSGQIQLRAMGAHTKRQAVQGPRYQGPFLKPADTLVNALYEEIESADHDLATLRAERLVSDDDIAELEQSQRRADDRLRRAREAFRKILEKQRDALELEPKALMMQQHFRDQLRAAQDSSLEAALEQCHLDCAYYPAGADADGEAPDNRMSEQRIPDKLLGFRTFVDASDLTNAEIGEAGLTSKCSLCMGPAAVPKRGLPKCERCSLKHSGLTARCSRCSAPVPLDLDDPQKQVVCKRCDFACFRCGRTAAISSNDRIITCRPCQVQWEAGALGYEVRTWSRETLSAKIKTTNASDEELEAELGREEIERYASLWHVPLIDGVLGS